MKSKSSGWRLGAVSLLSVVALTLVGCSQQANSQSGQIGQGDAQQTQKGQSIIGSVKLSPGGLYEMVYAPAQDNVYVASVGKRNVKDSSIFVLDADTLKVKDRIKLDVALFGLGINTKTQILYGTATGAGQVKAIDLETGEVIATISDKGKLREVIVDEASNRIYVSVMGYKDKQSSHVWVIDGKSNELVDKIEIESNALAGIALDEEHNRLFGVGLKHNEVIVVDLDTRKVVTHWDTGGKHPLNLTYANASNRLFVANYKSGTLTVLNADNGQLLATIETGKGALDVDLDVDEGLAYVANRKAGTTSVVDIETYEVIGQLETGTYPQTVDIDYGNNRVYVSNKAQTLDRDAPKDAKPPKDPNGDTVVLIQQ